MRVIRRASAILVAALALPLLALLPAQSAAADDEGLLLSTDGTRWYTSLVGNVFATDTSLVPGDTLRGRFYVMNNRTEPAFVRVGLTSLVVSSLDFAAAVSLTTIGSTPSSTTVDDRLLGAPGTVCANLVERAVPLPPHGVLRVTSDLVFSAAAASSAGEIANLQYVIELSDVDLDALSRPLCTNDLTVVTPVGPADLAPLAGGPHEVTPISNPDPDPVPDPDGATPAATPAPTGGSEPTTACAATGECTTIISSSAGGTIELGEDGSPIPPWPTNTVRSWEEYAILILIGAALAGLLARYAAERGMRRGGRTR